MREELQPVLKAIEDRQLPTEAGLLFNGLLDTKGLEAVSTNTQG